MSLEVIIGNEADEQAEEHDTVETAPIESGAELPVIADELPELTGGADLLALFGDEAPTHYEVVTIPFITPKGQRRPVTLHIKRLSAKEEASLDARIARRNSGQISPQSRNMENTNATGLLIAETAYLSIKEGETQRYVRMFTVEQILGRDERKNGKTVVQPRVIGLFDRTENEAINFGNMLAAAALQVNPSMNPALKKMAERALAMQYGMEMDD